MVRFLSLFSVFLLNACGTSTGLNMGKYPDPTATPQEFIHCHGYGCSQRMLVGFNESEWRSIKHIFRKEPKSALIERKRIAKAIALMEQYMGAITETDQDLPKAPIKRVSHKELDCIDETINTTKYLNFLQKENLFKFHELVRPVHKGIFHGAYPHNSAAVKEIGTRQVFTVDSYIHENGKEPVIRALEDWLARRTFEGEES